MVQAIEAPISGEELLQALKDMPAGKSPGPDSLSAQYYKQFPSVLVPHFLTPFNLLREEGRLHDDSLRAHATIIPKEGKDPTECQTYRPISLLSVDLKLFTRVLASRVLQHMPKVIHYDQVGFIATRETRDSVTWVIDIMH